jgi:hypothetical protein
MLETVIILCTAFVLLAIWGMTHILLGAIDEAVEELKRGKL